MSWSIVKSNNRMIDDILYTLIIEHLYCFSKKNIYLCHKIYKNIMYEDKANV